MNFNIAVPGRASTLVRSRFVRSKLFLLVLHDSQLIVCSGLELHNSAPGWSR